MVIEQVAEPDANPFPLNIFSRPAITTDDNISQQFN